MPSEEEGETASDYDTSLPKIGPKARVKYGRRPRATSSDPSTRLGWHPSTISSTHDASSQLNAKASTSSPAAAAFSSQSHELHKPPPRGSRKRAHESVATSVVADDAELLENEAPKLPHSGTKGTEVSRKRQPSSTSPALARRDHNVLITSNASSPPNKKKPTLASYTPFTSSKPLSKRPSSEGGRKPQISRKKNKRSFSVLSASSPPQSTIALKINTHDEDDETANTRSEHAGSHQRDELHMSRKKPKKAHQRLQDTRTSTSSNVASSKEEQAWRPVTAPSTARVRRSRSANVSLPPTIRDEDVFDHDKMIDASPRMIRTPSLPVQPTPAAYPLTPASVSASHQNTPRSEGAYQPMNLASLRAALPSTSSPPLAHTLAMVTRLNHERRRQMMLVGSPLSASALELDEEELALVYRAPCAPKDVGTIKARATEGTEFMDLDAQIVVVNEEGPISRDESEDETMTLDDVPTPMPLATAHVTDHNNVKYGKQKGKKVPSLREQDALRARRYRPPPVDAPYESGRVPSSEDDLAYAIRTTGTGEESIPSSPVSSSSSPEERALVSEMEKEIQFGLEPGKIIRTRDGIKNVNRDGKKGSRSWKISRQLLPRVMAPKYDAEAWDELSISKE